MHWDVLQRSITIGLTAFALAACDSDKETGPVAPAAMRIVSGATASDTIQAQLTQFLVEVTREGGRSASGVAVRFETDSLPTPSSPLDAGAATGLCPASTNFCGLNAGQILTVTTGADGRAAVIVRLGTVAKTVIVRAAVADLSLKDSATYTVRPGNAAQLLPVGDTVDVDIGASSVLQARVADRYRNVRADAATFTTAAGTVLTIDQTAGSATGREMGFQRIYSRFNTLADSTVVRVLPPGRLIAWDPLDGSVSIMNLNGSNSRVVVRQVTSRLGVFPQFDATRQRITLRRSTLDNDTPNVGIITDTLGAQRRDFGAALEFDAVLGERQLADGTLLLAGRRTSDGAGYWIFRIATDNTVTRVTGLPGLTAEPEDYGGVDFSHDGTRVAYLAPIELRVLNIQTNTATVLAPNARSPRWSRQDDRIAFLVPQPPLRTPYDGSLVVINADGTGRRNVSDEVFSPGIAWSPDGNYLLAKILGTFRLFRLSDGYNLSLQYTVPAPAGIFPSRNAISFNQPDWR